MTPRQLAALLGQMDELDKGRRLPNLPGPYGTFLARYARERRDVVDLALAAGIDVRRDGAVSGTPLEHITLQPLFPEEVGGELDTSWGKQALVLALCPELMTCVTARLWLEAGSARDAYRLVLAGRGPALVMYGDFRWLPPGVITAGAALFRTQDAGPDSEWTDAPYLKTTGDDIADIPHALDYSCVLLNGQGLLAQFKSFVMRLVDGEFVAVGGIRSKPTRVSLVNPRVLPDVEGLVLCLGYRQPGELAWTVWKWAPIDTAAAIRHNMLWAVYVRSVAGEQPMTPEIAEACAASVGGQGPQPTPTWLPPTLAEPRLDRFQKQLTRRLRLGGRS